MILTPEEIQSRISLFCLFLVKALVSHLTLQLQQIRTLHISMAGLCTND